MEILGLVPILVVSLITIGLPVAAIVLTLRRRTDPPAGQAGVSEIDFGLVYFYLVSFVTLAIASYALIAAIGQALDLGLGTYYEAPEPRPMPPGQAQEPGFVKPAPDYWVRQQLATSASAFLVATPVWLFHWLRGRRRAHAKGALHFHRAYLYIVSLLALLVAVIFAVILLSKGVGLALGVFDLGTAKAQRELLRDVLTPLLSLAVAAAIWLAHWRGTGFGKASGGDTG